jgi:VanZ family protein
VPWPIESPGPYAALVGDRTSQHAGRSRAIIVSWLPAIAWAGVIFAFSAQPNLRFVPDAGLDFIVRKAGHMGVFGILALLAWWALAETTTWRWPWAWALGSSVLYAMTDEFHQGFVAGRHPSVVDVGIDTTGALIAVGVVSLVRSRRRSM